jgi:HK97 gp10 family phage protein
MDVEMKLTGFDGLEAALDDLPKATAKNVVRRILEKRAQPFADTARQLVPMDKGHLKKSITVSSTKVAKTQRKEIKKLQNEGFVTMHIGPGQDPAAHLQEFGSSQHPAQPFMRPAWDQNKDDVLDGMADDLWKEIDKAAKRLAKKAAKAAKAKG